MSDDIRVPREQINELSNLLRTGRLGDNYRAREILDALLAAPPAAPDSAKLVSELRDHADEQGRDDAAAISSWGYLRSQTTRELLEKAANWIEQHDAQTAQPDSAQEAAVNALYRISCHLGNPEVCDAHGDVFARLADYIIEKLGTHPPQPVMPVEAKE